MGEDRPIVEVGNLPPLGPSDRDALIEHLRADYRERLGLAPDAPVEWVDGTEPGTGFLYQPGSFVRLEGGELNLSGWTRRDALRSQLRRAWGWLRYGWRWW